MWVISPILFGEEGQEQRYFFQHQELPLLFPEIVQKFAYGAPASTPELARVVKIWKSITKAADPWLDQRTSTDFEAQVVVKGKQRVYTNGNLVQRLIYHYWYHAGENMAIRQLLGRQQPGHSPLPEFVGNLDDAAPYRPDRETL